MTKREDLKKEKPEPYYGKIIQNIDGISEWIWRLGDDGGFNGPASEWNTIRDAVLKYTTGRDLIVQAGGCCGMYPRLWSKYFKTVHTFEPVDNNFDVLCRNCPSDNIHKHHAALGEFEGFVRMTGGKEYNPETNERFRNVGMYWVHGVYNSGVYQMPLDKLNLPKVDAIQLDVEKYETKVLKGAIETIKKYKPTICIETYNLESQELLLLLGYQVVDRAARDYVLAFKP